MEPGSNTGKYPPLPSSFSLIFLTSSLASVGKKLVDIRMSRAGHFLLYRRIRWSPSRTLPRSWLDPRFPCLSSLSIPNLHVKTTEEKGTGEGHPTCPMNTNEKCYVSYRNTTRLYMYAGILFNRVSLSLSTRQCQDWLGFFLLSRATAQRSEMTDPHSGAPKVYTSHTNHFA